MSRDPRTLDPRFLDPRYVFGLNGFENQLYPYFWGESFGSFVAPSPGPHPPALSPSYMPTPDPYAPPSPYMPTPDPYAPPSPYAPTPDPYAPSGDAYAAPTTPTRITATPGDVSSAFFFTASPLTAERGSAARPAASPSPGALRPEGSSGGFSRVDPPRTSGCASCGALPPRTSGLSASPERAPALGHGQPYGGPIATPGLGDLGGMVRRLPLPGQVTADASTFLPQQQPMSGGAGWARVGGAGTNQVAAMALPSPRSERRRGALPAGTFGPLLSPPPLPRFLPTRSR